MKNIKKLLSIVMVLAMVLALGTQALAATITIESKDGLNVGHTYEAYQIFTGSQVDKPDDAPLGDLKWGSGIKAQEFVTALQADTMLKSYFENVLKVDNKVDGAAVAATSMEAAQNVAKVLEGLDGAKDKELLNRFAKLAFDNASTTKVTLEAGKGADVEDGYYVIKDTTSLDGKDDVENSIMLQVTEDINVSIKYDKPTVEKKVKDINDTTQKEMQDWKVSADHDIGDEVPFQIKAKVQNEGYDLYETYKTVLHDVQSTGLTVLAYTMTIQAGGKTYAYDFVSNSFKDADGTEAKGVSLNASPTDGCTFEIVIEDTKALGVPAGGEIVVEYKSRLNDDAVIGPTGNPNEVTLEFSNDYHNDGTGKTPKSRVIVFTYDLDVNKVDADKKPLTGADFKLFKEVNEKYVTREGESITWVNKKTGERTTDDKSTESLDWVRCVEVELTKSDYTKNDGATAKDAKFYGKGIDDGKYIIVETTTPAGYNTIDPVEFEVKVNHNVESDAELTGDGFTSIPDFNFTLKPTKDEGMYDTEIVNESGVTLPETGGIGTTIFYVVGAILVAGAAILLVTKKRANDATK